MATNGYNEHLNPRSYLTNSVVKFHIQNVNDVQGVAICGGIYSPEHFNVFSSSFVLRFDEKNQCKCCIAELHRRPSFELVDHKTWALTSDLVEVVSV